MTPRERHTCIICQVSISMGVSPRVIMGQSRARPIARARQAIMRRLYQYGLSVSEIGRILGRDHTTVIHGIRRAEA